jgi:hypothetical protein
MSYVPVVKVLTDGKGHYLGIVVCDCDDGSEGWEPDYKNCPVHRVEQAKGDAHDSTTAA